jgi:hypothetical protein
MTSTAAGARFGSAADNTTSRPDTAPRANGRSRTHGPGAGAPHRATGDVRPQWVAGRDPEKAGKSRPDYSTVRGLRSTVRIAPCCATKGSRHKCCFRNTGMPGQDVGGASTPAWPHASVWAGSRAGAEAIWEVAGFTRSTRREGAGAASASGRAPAK